MLGAVTSSAGSAAQTSAQNKATDKANLDSQRKELNRLVRLLGPERGLAEWKAGTDKAIVAKVLGTPARAGGASPEQQAQLASLDKQIADLKAKGGGLNAMGRPGSNKANNAALAQLQAQRDSLAQSTGSQGGTAGMLDENSIKALGPGLEDKYNALADESAKTATGNLSQYDAATAGLGQQSRDIESQAKNFGVQELSNLKEDTDREQQSLDRKSLAALNNRGIGAGSAATDALAGNSDQTRRQYNAAKAGIEDRQINLRTGLATGSLGVAASRSQGRTGLLTSGQANTQGLRLGALNTEQSALTGDTPYYPGSGNSPGASAAMTAGSTLTGYASPLAGYAFRNWMSGGGAGAGSAAPNTGLDSMGESDALGASQASLGY